MSGYLEVSIVIKHVLSNLAVHFIYPQFIYRQVGWKYKQKN